MIARRYEVYARGEEGTCPHCNAAVLEGDMAVELFTEDHLRIKFESGFCSYGCAYRFGRRRGFKVRRPLKRRRAGAIVKGGHDVRALVS